MSSPTEPSRPPRRRHNTGGRPRPRTGDSEHDSRKYRGDGARSNARRRKHGDLVQRVMTILNLSQKEARDFCKNHNFDADQVQEAINDQLDGKRSPSDEWQTFTRKRPNKKTEVSGGAREDSRGGSGRGRGGGGYRGGDRGGGRPRPQGNRRDRPNRPRQDRDGHKQRGRNTEKHQAQHDAEETTQTAEEQQPTPAPAWGKQGGLTFAEMAKRSSPEEQRKKKLEAIAEQKRLQVIREEEERRREQEREQERERERQEQERERERQEQERQQEMERLRQEELHRQELRRQEQEEALRKLEQERQEVRRQEEQRQREAEQRLEEERLRQEETERLRQEEEEERRLEEERLREEKERRLAEEAAAQAREEAAYRMAWSEPSVQESEVTFDQGVSLPELGDFEGTVGIKFGRANLPQRESEPEIEDIPEPAPAQRTPQRTPHTSLPPSPAVTSTVPQHEVPSVEQPADNPSAHQHAQKTQEPHMNMQANGPSSNGPPGQPSFPPTGNNSYPPNYMGGRNGGEPPFVSEGYMFPQQYYEPHYGNHFYGQQQQRQHPKGNQRRNQNRRNQGRNQPNKQADSRSQDLQQGAPTGGRGGNPGKQRGGYKQGGYKRDQNIQGQFPNQYGYQHNQFQKQNAQPQQPYAAKPAFKQNQVPPQYQGMPQHPQQQFGASPYYPAYPYPYYHPQAQFRGPPMPFYGQPPGNYMYGMNGGAEQYDYGASQPEVTKQGFQQEQVQHGHQLQQGFPGRTGSADETEPAEDSSKTKPSDGGNGLRMPYHYGQLQGGPQTGQSQHHQQPVLQGYPQQNYLNPSQGGFYEDPQAQDFQQQYQQPQSWHQQ